MTGRFIYETDGITYSTSRFADIRDTMLGDARRKQHSVFCEVCICGHHSYCLRATPDGELYRIYTHLRGGRNGTEERVLPVCEKVC